MSASLAVVADNAVAEAQTPATEPLNERIRRLQAEARDMARRHVALLEASIVESARLAGEIAEGGDAYPVGVREMARQLTAECEARVLSLEAILHRSGDMH